MGGTGSTSRKVSFGLDENEKVTVIEGVKLSGDVMQRMRESQGADGAKSPPSSPPESQKPPPSPTPTAPPTTEIQEEMRKTFERQQALVQEQLASLAEKEKETAATTGVDELLPSLIIEKGKVHEEKEKAKLLPADLDAWTKQLERKEQELASISSYYKEQIDVLEKKNFDIYKESTEQYNQSATRAEAHIRPRHTAPVCSELQAKVVQCYGEHPQQTLLCSSLAKQYITCVQQTKKSSLTNQG